MRECPIGKIDAATYPARVPGHHQKNDHYRFQDKDLSRQLAIAFAPPRDSFDAEIAALLDRLDDPASDPRLSNRR